MNMTLKPVKRGHPAGNGHIVNFTVKQLSKMVVVEGMGV
jgi:hypothetical protein